MKKFMPYLSAALAAVMLLALAAGGAAAAEGKSGFSAAQLKLMSTFLSNFTELWMYDFDADEMLKSDDIIDFGVRHNYVNNYDSAISPCKIEGCPHGSLVIDAKRVAETVKKYFGADFKDHHSVKAEPDFYREYVYYYDGSLYHFEGSDGEAVYYARVERAEQDPAGRVVMTGTLYNADDEDDILGTFEALAKPYKYGGKDTWAILSLKSDIGEDEYFPVLVDGQLVGAFDEGGKWRDAPESVTVGGREVALDDVEGDEALMKRFEDEESVPCDTPLIAKGRRLAYWSPGGKEGEGTVGRVSISYEGESSGMAELNVEVEGYELDWTKLVVGMAAEIDNPLPAPTVRKVSDAGVIAFTCDYKGGLSVVWTPKDDSFTGAVSAGGKTWNIPSGEDDPQIAPDSEEDTHCGFFDLNGDGKLELVVYDSGPNGFAAILGVDPDKGINTLSWQYTGAE
jgi:hypothetical protein